MSATKRQAKRSRPHSFDENLALANSSTRELASRFWGLGDTDTFEASTTRTGLKVKFSGHNHTAMLLYPQWNSVMFTIGPIKDAGLDDMATDIVERLSAMAGKRLPDRQPAVSAESVLEAWEDLVDVVLPRYRAAHEEARRVRRMNRDG